MSPRQNDRNRPDQPEIPGRIGAYRVLEGLGEGGMGVVYLAEQTEPVKRQVALKIIKPGMDTRKVVARFEAERQALAVMDHPNIATVYDGGATESGRPYFVMELVRGVPINEYCDMHKLSIRGRLELFIPICQAIQHAHQKGVIHRDLKPSNILVTLQEGKPVPKVIDFGIAKAIGHRLTERTLHTARGEIIGTPAYMSPEQAEMTGLDVDTRTDIYSLGVMLYQLLAGDLPYDPKDLTGYAAIVTLRETEPPTPSSRFRSLGDRRQSIAEHRQTDPGSLGRRLKADLDWITMKAIEKDRTRRYETANGLALDVQRYLNNEPVMARAPSAAYRAAKFVSRHKAGVAFATAIFLLLAASAVVMAVSRHRAVAAEGQARLEAAKSAAINEFLQGMLSSADPWQQGREVKVADVLDQSARGIEGAFEGQPEVGAEVRATIGRTYRNLGLYAEAEPQLRAAVEIYESALPGDSPTLAWGLADLAELLRLMGDYDRAEELERRALAIRRDAFGEGHPEVARSLDHLAVILNAKGDYAAAEELFRRALEMRRQAQGEESLDVAETLDHLGTLIYAKGDHDEAISLFREALATRRRVLGAEHLDVAMSLNNLAIALNTLERFDEAEPLYLESLAINRKLFGERHPGVAQSLNNLGMFYYRQGGYDRAEALFREALALNREFFGDVHVEVASNLNNLGLVLRDRGDYDEAEMMFREMVAIDREVRGANNPHVATGLVNLGALLTRAGRLAEAEQTFREARDIQLQTFPPGHWQVATTESLLGECLTRMGRYASAEPLLVNSYGIISREFGAQHGRARVALRRVIELYDAWGETEKAAEYRALSPENGTL